MWWEQQIAFVQALYIIPGFIGIVVAFRKLKEQTALLVLLLSIVLYFLAMTVGTFSIMRYMIPAMPFVFMFAAIPISILVSSVLKRKRFIP